MIARALVALTGALVLACAGLAAHAEGSPPPGVAPIKLEPQQVLVLLRMAPPHAHAAGDPGGAYGDAAAHAARRREAQRLARAHGLQLLDGWPMPILGVDCYIMAVPDGRSAEAVAGELAREPGVEQAQVSHLFHAQASAYHHADPMFAAQPAAREWRLDDLHEIATGRGVRVAVIDSMVDRNHPDLAGQVEIEQNFVPGPSPAPEAHGTGVAGIIAAKANGVGIVGVAPEARLLALRACWQLPAAAGVGATVCDSLSLAKALHYAIDARAQVVNLSLSGPPDVLLGRLIDVAEARGMRVVAAYDRRLPRGGFPASHAGVIAVAEESLSPPPPGVYSAPGRDVPTTEPGGRWFLVDGSSYAAAHVSGLLALVRQERPMEKGALALVAARSGGGIDACASLLRVIRRADCACAHPQGQPTLAR
jgi:subtilisin family serine protease